MNRNTLFWGFVFIMAGLIFLLSNLGIIMIDAWSILFPLFLISLGIWVLLGVIFRKQGTGQNVSIALDEVVAAHVKFEHGAGRLSLSSGGGPEELLSGVFQGGVDYLKKREGDSLKVKIRASEHNFPFFWLPGEGLNWKVGLNKDIPLSLDIKTGASECDINLADLQVTRFILGTGASSSNITLPAKVGFTRAKIESGAASVKIKVPENVAARIAVKSGLSGIEVDQNRFPPYQGAYQSENYNTAAYKVDMEIDMGVGHVKVY
jgi:hypothetical protein